MAILVFLNMSMVALGGTDTAKGVARQWVVFDLAQHIKQVDVTIA